MLGNIENSKTLFVNKVKSSIIIDNVRFSVKSKSKRNAGMGSIIIAIIPITANAMATSRYLFM
jgi:hypothetical protein